MAIGHAAERRRPPWLAQLTPDHRDRGARWHQPEARHADVTRSRSADRRVEFLGRCQLHHGPTLEIRCRYPLRARPRRGADIRYDRLAGALDPAQISVTRTAPLRDAGRAARGWRNRLRALPLIS